MKRIKRYILVVCSLILVFKTANCQADRQADSSSLILEQTDSVNTDTSGFPVLKLKLRNAADSVYVNANPQIGKLCNVLFEAMQQDDKKLLLDLTPTYDAYLLFIDSSQAANYTEVVKQYKHRVFKSNISKQYKRLKKDAKELKVNVKRSEGRLFFLEHGIHPEFDRAFCYINLEMKKGKTDFIRIQILALKMGEDWFFADDLALLVIKKDKVRKPY
jgi:hypothetical protein